MLARKTGDKEKEMTTSFPVDTSLEQIPSPLVGSGPCAASMFYS